MSQRDKGLVMVGLSGGVDSAVAALMLLEQGYRVEALFMKNWEEDDRADYCSAAADLADAQEVAGILGVTLHSVNFSTEYWDRVFEHFLAEYRAGRTPNPDVLCNREIKFKAFLDYALGLGAQQIATGHYARNTLEPDGWHLRCGVDPDKDQTYFLYTLGQRQLGRSLFPLGALRKTEVRRRARDAGLPNHSKKDSTGICFIGERRFRDFLSRYLPAKPGPIETPDGRPLGTHHGLMYYTLGQRKGMGIGGQRNAGEEPWFAAVKDLERNTLIVAQGHDHPLLFHPGLEASQLYWISGRPPAPLPYRCSARIRHRQALQPCSILGLDAEHCRVRFAEPQRAIAPGQSVVFYRADDCLGGGVIESHLDF